MVGDFLIALALFVLLLAVLAGVADLWDSRERSDARDARRRNPQPHARRVR